MASAPNASQLDPGSIALLQCQLEPGEQLLWGGKPQWFRDPFLRIRVATIFTGFGIVTIGCWYFLPRHRWWNALAYIVGSTSVNFALIWKGYHSDRDSLFGLTNRRAIRMWPLHSVALINDQGQPVSIRRRMLGRVTIGDTAVSTWNGVPRYVKSGTTAFLDFFAIPHPEVAEQIALAAQRRELGEQKKLPAA